MDDRSRVISLGTGFAAGPTIPGAMAEDLRSFKALGIEVEGPLPTSGGRTVALEALEEFATGRRPDAVEAALAMRGHQYSKGRTGGKLAHRTAGAVEVSPLAARALALLGVDPRAIAVGAMIFGHGRSDLILSGITTRIILNESFGTGRRMPLVLSAEIMIDRNIQFCPSQGIVVMHVNRIPDTALPSLAGMHLREVVSHPLLDALDLTIAGVSDRGEGIAMHIIRYEHRVRIDTLPRYERD